MTTHRLSVLINVSNANRKCCTSVFVLPNCLTNVSCENLCVSSNVTEVMVYVWLLWCLCEKIANIKGHTNRIKRIKRIAVYLLLKHKE